MNVNVYSVVYIYAPSMYSVTEYNIANTQHRFLVILIVN